MTRPGPKPRNHTIFKIRGKADDQAAIRAYLAEVQRVQHLTTRSAAGMKVLLYAKEVGLLLDTAPMQDLQM